MSKIMQTSHTTNSNPTPDCDSQDIHDSLLGRMKRSVYNTLCWNSPDSQTHVSRQNNEDYRCKSANPAYDFSTNKEAIIGVVKKYGDYLYRETCTLGQTAKMRLKRDEWLLDYRHDPNPRPRNVHKSRPSSRQRRRYALSYQNSQGGPPRRGGHCVNEHRENVDYCARNYADDDRQRRVPVRDSHDSRKNRADVIVERACTGTYGNKIEKADKMCQISQHGEGERERKMASHSNKQENKDRNHDGKYIDTKVRPKNPEPKDTRRKGRNYCDIEYCRCDKMKKIMEETSSFSTDEKDRRDRNHSSHPKEDNSYKENKQVPRSVGKKCRQIYELSEDQCRNFKERGYVKVNVRVKPNVSVSDFDIVIRKDKVKTECSKS